MMIDASAALRRLGRPAAALLAAGALLWAAAPAEAATYYVRTSGSNSNSGLSAGAAFRTIQQAGNTATAGDTVFVGAGVYTQTYGGLKDGTAGNVILWIADTSGSATGDAGTVTLRPVDGGLHAIRFGLEYYITFRGFRFAANPNAPDASGVYLNDSDNIRFEYCTFDGLNYGLDSENGDFTADGCAFTNCRAGAVLDDADAAFVDCTFDVPTDGGTTYGLHLETTDAALTGCTVDGGDYGVYHPTGGSGGAGLTLTDCTVQNASFIGLWVGAQDAEIRDCEFAGCYAGIFLDDGPASNVDLFDTVVRDGTTGIYTERADPDPVNVTLSGHADAGLRIAPQVTTFTLMNNETLTCTGNQYGVAWDRPSATAGTGSLTVDQKTWTGNTIHVYAEGVQSVTVEDADFAGGAIGVRVGAADACTLRRVTADGCGASEDWYGARWGAYLTAAAVTVDDCAFENGHRGLGLFDCGDDPDVRNVACRDNDEQGLEAHRTAWTWNAADAITLTGNRIGLVAYDSAVTIDGGAAGIDIAGNTAAGYTHAVYADGGTLTFSNVRVADSHVGFDLRNLGGATLTDCTATDCAHWGAYVKRGTEPADVAATLRRFAATGCGSGVGYERGSAAGVGQIVLDDVTATRAVSLDADGVPNGAAVWPYGTSGNGVFLWGCPLDPGYHAGLTATGHSIGALVMDADATMTAASAPSFGGCAIGLQVKRGSADLAGWTADGTFYPVEFDPDHAAHDLALTDCNLWGAFHAVRTFDLAGSATATGCTFASRDGDAVRLEAPVEAPAIAFTNCTVATAGDDGFRVDYQGAAGGSPSFTDCRVIAAGGDGFDLITATAGSGTATFVRCAVDSAGDDGFDLDGPAGVLRDCTVTSAGDDAFTLHSATADVADCAALAAGGVGFLLRDCPAGTIARCVAHDCTSAGVETQEACGTISVENVLCVNCEDGLQCETTSGTTTYRHCTAVVNDDAFRVYSGTATAVNCVLVGGDVGAKADGGTAVALDHVLIDSPTPYHGVAAGPDDLLGTPRFADAPGGDYRLGEGSPAINAGKDLTGTVDDDLLGATRPAHRRHDLGAYEFTSAAGSLRILEWRERAE